MIDTGERVPQPEVLARLGARALKCMLQTRGLPDEGDVHTLAKRLHEMMTMDGMELDRESDEGCGPVSSPSAWPRTPGEGFEASAESRQGRPRPKALPKRPRRPPPGDMSCSWPLGVGLTWQTLPGTGPCSSGCRSAQSLDVLGLDRSLDSKQTLPSPRQLPGSCPSVALDFANFEGATAAAIASPRPGAHVLCGPSPGGAGAACGSLDETVPIAAVASSLSSRPLPVGTYGPLSNSFSEAQSAAPSGGLGEPGDESELRPYSDETSARHLQRQPPLMRTLSRSWQMGVDGPLDASPVSSDGDDTRRSTKKQVLFMVPEEDSRLSGNGLDCVDSRGMDCAGSAGLVVHDQAQEVESVHAGETTGRASLSFRNEGGKRLSILRPIRPSTHSTCSRRSSLSAVACSRQQRVSLRVSPDRRRRMTDMSCAGSESDGSECDTLSTGPLSTGRLQALLASLDLCAPTSLSRQQAEMLQKVVAAASTLLAAAPASRDAHHDATPQTGEAHPMASELAVVSERAVASECTASWEPAAQTAVVPCEPTGQGESVEQEASALAPLGAMQALPPHCALERRCREDEEHVVTQKPAVGLEVGADVEQAVAAVWRRKGPIPALQTPSPRRHLAVSVGEAQQLFKRFVTAANIEEIEESFACLVECSEMNARIHQRSDPPDADRHPYALLRCIPGLPWKAAKVWELLDLQVGKEDYTARRLRGQRVMVVGAGPVGLRLAVEARLAGATVTVLEKRGEFSRINRLHLWDWVKQDLVSWGAKLFSPPGGSFGADKDYCHIGTSELQLLLLKCCLLLGVSVEMGVEFRSAQFAEEAQSWFAETQPPLEGDQPLMDALICCDGASSRCAVAHGSVPIKAGLGREGKAIGIVANFANSHTQEERDLRQFSWARQFNAQLFSELKGKLGVDLENIVYYKGDMNHYLIMTPSKQCLVELGCLKSPDPPQPELPLLHASNVELGELQDLARRVASYFGLPTTFTPEQSVSFFDFSDTRRHEQAILFKQDGAPEGSLPLPVCLAGDALLEPFWPTGLGCIRGFLSALDCVSSLQLWFSTYDLELVARHSEQAYKLLKSVEAQTKDKTLRPEKEWRVDPGTRYRGFRPVADCWRKSPGVGSLPLAGLTSKDAAHDLAGCKSDSVATWRRLNQATRDEAASPA